MMNFIYQWPDVSISLDRMNEIHTQKDEENENRISKSHLMTTEPALVGYLNYKSKETKWAVFTGYNWTNTKLSLNTGLRYEVLSSMYDDLPSVEDNVKKKYHNIFPSFKISYSDKG
ncbi:TonB-dependent receptor, partial [Proteiniphilum sp. X52]